MAKGALMTRGEISEVVSPSAAKGLLLMTPGAGVVVPIAPPELDLVLELSRSTLRAAGIAERDRVLIALNGDGEMTSTILATACLAIADATSSFGPRGRMRLLRAIQMLRPTVLVMTPTGAHDFLSRLHIEFLVDPADLGLEHLFVVGEIASSVLLTHLQKELCAPVTELYIDPVFGAVLGQRKADQGRFELLDPSVISFASLTDDERVRAPNDDRLLEFVLEPAWSKSLSSYGIRTGQVAASGDGVTQGGTPRWDATVGDEVLVRGRWLSVEAIDRALRRIDGIAGWKLEITRSGTLDNATVEVALGRSTLESSAMWRGRITDAIIAVSPVRLDVSTTGADVLPDDSHVIDHRGHHLGVDRKEAIAPDRRR
jgi:phenylacetate-CoA ligase